MYRNRCYCRVSGETKAHFDETVANLLTMPIHYFHVFSYSERKICQKHQKTIKVNPATIAERSKILRKISEQKRQAFYKSHNGKKITVLFESKKNDIWQGLTDNYIKVQHKNNTNLKNKFVSLEYHINYNKLV